MSRLACGVINAAYDRGIVSSVNTLGNRRVPEITQFNVGTVSTPVYANISGDPRVLGYRHGSDDCVMVAAYTYDVPGYPGAGRVALFKIDATTGDWEQLIQKEAATWGFSNPYGLVVVGNNMYVQDYDSGAITVVNLTTYATSTLYTVAAVTDGGITYLPHGNGMDYHASTGRLIAVYSFLPSGSYTNYYPSKLIAAQLVGGTAVVSGLNKNVVAVTVDEDYAYVCSIGGAQQGGGNSASKIQTVSLSPLALLTPEITTSTSPVSSGDFVDVAFWDGAAYVLQANYNTAYTQYSYQLIQTSGSDIRGGTFGTYTTTTVLTASPADATWMLGPSEDALWFVSGSAANIVELNGSGELDSGSVTKKADASLSTSSIYGLGTTIGSDTIAAHLNTASVVIDAADAVARKKIGAAAVAAARTKVAFKFVRPEELEALEQSAAAKQK